MNEVIGTFACGEDSYRSWVIDTGFAYPDMRWRGVGIDLTLRLIDPGYVGASLSFWEAGRRLSALASLSTWKSITLAMR